jgi:hypothetical protein
VVRDSLIVNRKTRPCCGFSFSTLTVKVTTFDARLARQRMCVAGESERNGEYDFV